MITKQSAVKRGNPPPLKRLPGTRVYPFVDMKPGDMVEFTDPAPLRHSRPVRAAMAMNRANRRRGVAKRFVSRRSREHADVIEIYCLRG